MESLKILVLGDLGVGKSSFLKLISERFNEIYPINVFDYFMYLDEEEEKKQFINARDLAQNNSTKQNVETIVESMFFQAKKNFLEFIENKMNAKNFFYEERHKYTYGFEIFTFLWNRNNDYNNNIFEKNIPLNIIKKEENLTSNTVLYGNKKDSGSINIIHSSHRGNSDSSDSPANLDDVLLVEFFEIGGVQSYSYIRNIFYEKHDGILLVYDSSNNKSYHNLVKWLYELYINTKPPSDIFCRAKKEQNRIWEFFQYTEINKKKKKKNSDDIIISPTRKEIKENYENYYNMKNKKYNEEEDLFLSDEISDIEKGHITHKEDILKGEIPIACIATKIDKKNSKQKPAFVKTPKTSYFYKMFFSDPLSNESIYGNRDNLKIKKEILKKLEDHISQAIEIKASSIDCVVDIEKFISFLKCVYNKKYNSPKTHLYR
ncbi:ras GTPAse [Plasmodium brasilianum]|uniref:Ras GTPAse, putative n=2 Tax=Plasmodium (Plasmodium) TaxID=418103 RepID=A0A1D3SMV9_PLAMA|nr:ras GTPAse, putative [Plasmodium malariae]KAI4837330.1 ras GTPAse [Plasmodium brasilianum]SCO93212.1 ras GTPAse, putative [Plasmodium malariae]